MSQKYFPMIEPPRGRLLYRTAHEPWCITVLRSWSFPGLWLVGEPWSASSLAAGPFAPADVRRALAYSLLAVPDGCELGPWQRAFQAFELVQLPSQRKSWIVEDSSNLPVSPSLYGDEDITGEVIERCCEPPRDAPKVEWVNLGRSVFTSDLLSPGVDYPSIRNFLLAGKLMREWNAHPRGSIVLADNRKMAGGFVVLDGAESYLLAHDTSAHAI